MQPNEEYYRSAATSPFNVTQNVSAEGTNQSFAEGGSSILQSASLSGS